MNVIFNRHNVHGWTFNDKVGNFIESNACVRLLHDNGICIGTVIAKI